MNTRGFAIAERVHGSLKDTVIVLLILASFVVNGLAPRLTFEYEDARTICYVVVNQSMLLMQFLPKIAGVSVRITAGLLQYTQKQHQQASKKQPMGMPDTSSNIVSSVMLPRPDGAPHKLILSVVGAFAVSALTSCSHIILPDRISSGLSLTYLIFLLFCFIFFARTDLCAAVKRFDVLSIPLGSLNPGFFYFN